MATTVAEVQVALGLTGTGTVVTGLKEVDAALGQVTKTASGGGIDTDRLFGGLDKLGTAMLAGGAAGAGLFGLAGKSAADFASQLIQVQNNTTLTDADIARMRATVLQLAADTGAPLGSLEQGFMRVANLTGDAASATAILTIANESAVSTGGDSARTANILANAMHEYGADVVKAADGTTDLAAVTDNAAHYMGVFHLAAAEGNMTLEQFSDSSGRAIGIAANLHVPVEDVSAAFAALTKHGFNAADAQTQVVDAMTHLINPTKASRDEIERLSKATGVDLVADFSATGLSSKGLIGVLTDLKTAYEKMGLSEAQAEQESLKIVNAQRGGLGVAALLGTGWGDYTKILADLNNQQLVNTITQESYNRTAETTAFQWGKLKQQAIELGIGVGDVLLPQLNAVAHGAETLLHDFQGLDAGTQATIVHVAEGAVGFLLLGGAVIKTTSYVRDLTGAVGDVIGAFGKKEAAKKTLTAANEALAKSAAGTGEALAGEGGAAAAAGAAIVDVAAVTVVAGAAAVGLVYGVSKAADALDQTGNRARDNTQAWDAAGFAIAHGGTEANGAVDAFTRLVVATGNQTPTVAQLSILWNQYVAALQAGGQSTDTLGLRLVDLAGFVRIASDRLGEGAVAGSTFNRSMGLLDIGARAVSAALPPLGGGLGTATAAFGAAVTAADDYSRALSDAEMQGYVTTRALDATATGADAAAVAFADLRAPATTTALGLQDIDIYGNGAQTALNDDANAALMAARAFDTASAAIAGYQKAGSQLKGEKDTLQTEFDDLIKKRDGTPLSGADAKKLADDQAALRDLDARSGKGPLSAADEQRRTDLRAEIAGLQAKVTAGTPLTPEEQARLDVIAGQINWLNGQIGVNQTNTRTATSAAVTAQQQAQGAATTATAAQGVAGAAQAAAAAGRGLAIQAPPSANPTTGLFATPPIDTRGVSGFDEFGQPYAGTKKGGVDAGGVEHAANITIQVDFTANGMTPEAMIAQLRQELVDGVYGALQGALGGPGGGGAPAGLMP